MNLLFYCGMFLLIVMAIFGIYIAVALDYIWSGGILTMISGYLIKRYSKSI